MQTKLRLFAAAASPCGPSLSHTGASGRRNAPLKSLSLSQPLKTAVSMPEKQKRPGKMYVKMRNGQMMLDGFWKAPEDWMVCMLTIPCRPVPASWPANAISSALASMKRVSAPRRAHTLKKEEPGRSSAMYRSGMAKRVRVKLATMEMTLVTVQYAIGPYMPLRISRW